MVTTRAASKKLAQACLPTKKAAASRRKSSTKKVPVAKKAPAVKNTRATKKASLTKESKTEIERIEWKNVIASDSSVACRCRPMLAITELVRVVTYMADNMTSTYQFMSGSYSEEALDAWRWFEDYKTSQMSPGARAEISDAENPSSNNQNVSMSNATMSFLDFPPEIRMLIYDHAFSDNKYIFQGPVGYCSLHSGYLTSVQGRIRSHKWYAQLWQPCLIQFTCKAIHVETRHLIRMTKTLRWRWPSCYRAGCLLRLPPWSPAKFDRIKKLELAQLVEAGSIVGKFRRVKEVVFDSKIDFHYHIVLPLAIAQKVVLALENSSRVGINSYSDVAQALGDNISVSVKIQFHYKLEASAAREVWAMRLEVPSLRCLEYSMIGGWRTSTNGLANR